MGPQALIAPLFERICYEDNHVLVVNKACGEIVQGDKTGDPTIVDALKAVIKTRDSKPGNVFLGLPHRLDRPTSGALVLAKTSKALSRLSEIFRDREGSKVYWAIVEGDAEGKIGLSGSLKHYLTRDSARNMSKAFLEEVPGSQFAELEFTVRARGDRYSLVEIVLITGRHHQIRAQLSFSGLAIKGDLKYGSSRSCPGGGICLHARRFDLQHPISKKQLSVLADPRQVQSDPIWLRMQEIQGDIFAS